jgi:hypothetical protein
MIGQGRRGLGDRPGLGGDCLAYMGWGASGLVASDSTVSRTANAFAKDAEWR